MLGVIDDVCNKGLVLMPGMSKPTVVLVVGSAHLPGGGTDCHWASPSISIYVCMCLMRLVCYRSSTKGILCRPGMPKQMCLW